MEELAPGDVHDALVICVAAQELLAVREEARVREAIVLQDDRRLHLVEDPIEPGWYPELETEVLARVLSTDLPVPIDILDHRPGRFGVAGLLSVAGARSVGDQEQLPRTCTANSIEDLGRPLRPPEEDQRDRRLQRLTH